ncbi:MAG: phage holin family protein [Paramuribaculum sp.]
MIDHNVFQSMLCAWLLDFFRAMGAWILLAAVLIITDLRFGIMAARKRGEQIRGSRKRRRSMNKLLDYCCWILVAYACRRSIGVVLGVPIVSVAIILYVNLNEIASALNNYCEYKGIKKRINVWKLIRGRHDIERALEDAGDRPDEEAEEVEEVK